MTNNKSKMLLVLAVVFALSSIGFGVAFGYGGEGETIVLNTPNAWATISPSKKLSAFNYTADISSILTYNASNRAFEIPSASDLLDPLNVFYVYPTTGTSISFTYEDFMPGLTSRDLPTGWNLVGTNTNGSAVDEFSTIESSVSTLYVPETANARKGVTGASWGTSANRDISKTNWPSTLLDSHDGYWIYLINPATYSKILD
jgi:hypothetical protein